VCHAARLCLVGYAALATFGVFQFWTGPEHVTYFNGFLKIDISSAAPWQYVLAATLNSLPLLLVYAISWLAWRLFGAYLEGRVVVVESGRKLQMIGVLALSATVLDFVMRSAGAWVMGRHLADTSVANHGFVSTNDVLYIALALVFIALGAIFKAAAELAEEHAQIV
jgi:hypothetical protein